MNKTCIIICIIFMVSLLSGCLCPNDYYEIYNTNKQITTDNEAYSAITFFLNDNSIDNETINFYRNELIKDVTDLSKKDIKFEKSKNYWTLDVIAIDGQGKIYRKVLCR